MSSRGESQLDIRQVFAASIGKKNEFRRVNQTGERFRQVQPGINKMNQRLYSDKNSPGIFVFYQKMFSIKDGRCLHVYLFINFFLYFDVPWPPSEQSPAGNRPRFIIGA